MNNSTIAARVWARGARSTALEASSPRAGRDGSQTLAGRALRAQAVLMKGAKASQEWTTEVSRKSSASERRQHEGGVFLGFVSG